jgi:phosphoribosylanthranilate isomerase
MSKIKICGMQCRNDIEIVNEFLPDFAGFIMSTEDKFRRQISADKAFKLSQMLDQNIKAVGVFVDEPMEFIEDICNHDIVEVVQLHGNENREYILELRKRIPNPIIKAVHVSSMAQIVEMEKLPCNYLLLDTAYKDKVGGGGVKFNWDLIPPKVSKPFFLAGGLSADNVQEAIKTVNPYCVDLSSSVETDGYKDREKVKEVIKKVRSAE